MPLQPEILDLAGWCILRMASADTLKVSDVLDQRGFKVWTPIDRKQGRYPRTRKQFEKTLPIMPSYVFADAGDIDGLRALSESPVRDCPHFSIFRHGDAFPIIPDSQLDALRTEEKKRRAIYERAKAKGVKAPTFDEGAEVLLSKGGFEGLSGRVVESKGSFTLVDIPGFSEPIKISSLLLADDLVTAEIEDRRSKAA